MKTSIMKKSLLDYAIKGKLSAKFRRENPQLSAQNEIKAYNAQIANTRKIKQKQLSTLEKSLKEKGANKQAIKTQIQAIKKEIAKLKEIEILALNNEVAFEIPSSWAWVKLGDICEIILGKTPPREIKKYWDNPKYKWISIGDMQERSVIKFTKESISEIAKQECFKDNIFKKGTLIVSFKLSIGKTSFLGFDGFHNEGIASIIPKIHKENDKFFKKILLEFLPYFTNLCESTGAIKGETLNKEKLENLLIPLPPLKEQESIAQKLESLIALADEFEATQENLKRIEKRIEKSLLRYAILGKLSAKFRRENPQLSAQNEINAYNAQIANTRKAKQKQLQNLEKSLKEKGANKQAIKSKIQAIKKEIAKLKEIEILALNNEAAFEIPNSWAWVKLGDICEIFTGDSINATTKAKYFTNLVSGINYIGTKDISDRREIAYENGIKIPQNMLDKFKIAHKDSTLLCVEGGSAGRKIGFLEQSVCFGNKLCCFKSVFANAKFIYFYLQNPYFIYEFNSNLTGIIGGVSKDKIQNFLIPLPPLNEQESIAKELDALFAISKGLRAE